MCSEQYCRYSGAANKPEPGCANNIAKNICAVNNSVYLFNLRKLTAEESARINTENQLQSEQAKASTAVVDADKYRYLFCLVNILISLPLPFHLVSK